MFRLLIFTLLFISFWPTANSQQNLIRNGSFEDEDIINNPAISCLQGAQSWETVAYTYHHGKGTSSHCRSKIGVPDGSNAVYLHAWIKKDETIGQKLSQPLIKGEKYKLSFYAAFYDVDPKYNHAFLDVSFGKDKPLFVERNPDLHEPVGKFFRENYTILELDQWKQFSFCFTASEDSVQYISFSSLNNDHLGSGISGSRVYIDDIKLIKDSIFFDIGKDTTICPGDSFTVGVPFECAESFIWYDDSANYVFDSVYTIYGPGNYYLSIINQCFSIGYDTLNVSLKGNPLIDIGPDTNICAGDTLQLIAKSNHKVHYRWQDGITTPHYEASKKGIYSVEVTNKCGFKASDTIEINTTSLPEFEIGDDFKLCHGDSFLIELMNDNYDYKWHDGSKMLSYTAKKQGVYWATATNNCGSFTDSIHADFYESLDVKFQEIFYQDNKILVVESNDYESYQWIYCDSTKINGETNQSFINPPAGVYAVIIQKNGCIDTSECKVVEDLNVVDPQLLLYPNPTILWLNVVWEGNFKEINLQIINMLGQEVLKKKFKDNEPIRFQLLVDDGPYLVEVLVDGHRKEYFKLIKTGGIRP